mgnify:CR=1 FL=1
MAIASPAQAEGFGEDTLPSSVMGAFRFMRDDPNLARMRPGKDRVDYLDKAMMDFADSCGVARDEFKRYLGDLLSLR